MLVPIYSGGEIQKIPYFDTFKTGIHWPKPFSLMAIDTYVIHSL